MAKKTSSKSEWRRFKKLESENEKLRKEVTRLRKHVKTKFVDELEERSNRIEKGQPAVLPTCEICGNDSSFPIAIERNDGSFEIKICKSCKHRGSMKKLKD